MRARDRARQAGTAKLGADFHKLWTASAISNLGDGVGSVAGPLLVASLTADPALVAGAAFAGQVPWLLFSLLSGVYVDRVDRQRLIVVVNLLRGAVMSGLALSIAFDAVTIPLVYAAFFLLGTGETLADTASQARLPAVVPDELLPRANARLGATFTVVNQFAAKPLGAWLFVAGAALAFGVNALTFVASALIVAAMRPVPRPAAEPKSEPEPEPEPKRSAVRHDIAEGVRALWAHGLLRTLALCLGAMNIVFCAAFAIFVLYARDRLGLSELGYGTLLTTFAVGGLIGSSVAGRLAARYGAAALLRAGLIVECVTHLTLALTTSPWTAGAILIVFGVHTMVWNVVVNTVRQRAVPDRLQGRVVGVYSLMDLGGAALGSLLGGLFARTLGLTAPFWIAFGCMVAVTAAAWRPFRAATTVTRPAPRTPPPAC
ncbi:MFS transporter [Spongiactinospora sp. 9N601]|uniref:MFS transporter n=1 Tax=Spongiactinospora sp. 9N601 TaxID=3375149 RepID=UPI00378EE6AD